MKQKVLFIINPVAGVKRKNKIPRLIKKYLDHSLFEHRIIYTQRRGHATELAKRAAAEKYDIVAVAGGDGSVNEAASGLMHTETALLILPYGSGNGLARHLHYSMHISRTIKRLRNHKVKHIDACVVNNHYFFSLVGIGFDAFVAKVFDRERTRGFITYAWAAVKSLWTYQTYSYRLTCDGMVKTGEAFIINLCNSNQYGYNIKIAPDAKLDDGWIDVVIIRKIQKWRAILLVFQVMWNLPGKENCMEYLRGKSIHIETNHYTYLQVDGETLHKAKEFTTQIFTSALKVVVH
ncbi:MAG: diacylglycerol/lipid kinase family protein [Chitinophagales bacterium]